MVRGITRKGEVLMFALQTGDRGMIRKLLTIAFAGFLLIGREKSAGS